MDTPIHNAEIVSPVETIMVVKAQLKKTMVTMSRLIKENQALREQLVSYDHATGIANEKDIALKAQLEVSLREIRGLKHEASVKCKEIRMLKHEASVKCKETRMLKHEAEKVFHEARSRKDEKIFLAEELGWIMRCLIVSRKKNRDLKTELDGLKEWMV